MKKSLLLLFLLLAPQKIFAQTTQFYLEDNLGDNIKARIYVVAEVGSQSQVQQVLYRAIDHGRSALQSFKKELWGITQKGSYSIGEDSALLMEHGLKAAKKSGGAFDIALGFTKENYKKITLNKKEGRLIVQVDGIKMDSSNILHGAMADIIAKDLSADGYNNLLVKVGPVFVSKGMDANGPWKIPVVRPNNKLATHMIFYKAQGDVGAASYPVGNKAEAITDPRSHEMVAPDLLGASIFGESGAQAQALSYALYVMGFQEAQKFLKKNKSQYRGVLTNLDGQYTHIPSLNDRSATTQKVTESPAKLPQITQPTETTATAKGIKELKPFEAQKVEETSPHSTRDTF